MDKFKTMHRRFTVGGLALVLLASLFLTASAPSDPDFQIGVPLDQAIVYSGGESSNLRDYDPATTYSAGDKLIFSGLVQLD
ncbi:MAG TPA: hypothetical protein PLR93_10150, partial [Anaerolineales bacterium]|nr:hypothetical protein [Anaerolineales bacterium]